ncbi:MAG TPA: phosphotransferase [Candidatus Polarisedimenticolia bacterium]|nr:phosphotransferase [Candidatus Polarisedimenticolia bacterium]
MGLDDPPPPIITSEAVRDYLRQRGHRGAQVESIDALGGGATSDVKAHGYGRPLLVTFHAGGVRRRIVVRTMAPDPFGHERRPDRAAALMLAFDTFNDLPRHIRALDLGAVATDGSLAPMPAGETFLVTEYAEGSLYADDLGAIARLAVPRPLDESRADALAGYLAALHRDPIPAESYARSLRDVVGSGEGIFGLSDSYPPADRVAPPARLLALENAANAWRWRLKDRGRRSRRIHGDFHPFNILFREDADFTLLDRSRGGAGDPADDLTTLTINHMVFALEARGAFDGALRAIWSRVWSRWMAGTGDREALEVVAPFFAWRALVLANPLWYPRFTEPLRDRLLRFAEALLAGAAFDPDGVDALLA